MMLPWRPVSIDGGPEILTSLTEAEAAKLRELARGKRVLEIGSAYGFSAITMAQTAEHVVAVDPHEDMDSLATMRENLRAYGVEGNISIEQARSDEVLPRYRGHVRFGLIFIDGDHSEQVCRRDIKMSLVLLADDGALAVHDYGEDSCPGVTAALDRLHLDMCSTPRVVDTLWVWP